jgi:predicted protein tyrosine phosphatase
MLGRRNHEVVGQRRAMRRGAHFDLTICGIPELEQHCSAGITHVLSITAPEDPEPLAFAAFGPHLRMALRFHDIIEPMPDRLAPSRDDVLRLLAFGRGLKAGDRLLVHCHAGVSRSTAAAALILAQAQPDRPAREVLEAIVELRPRAWPNLRMLELGDELLCRGGEIIAAVAPIYARALDRDPDFGDIIIDNGRGREVSAGRNFRVS